jgi:hypothetical protein
VVCHCHSLKLATLAQIYRACRHVEHLSVARLVSVLFDGAVDIFDENRYKSSVCDQTRVPNEAQQIADTYHAVTIEAAWYGPSLAELLAKISPELATTAIPEAHSISALLQHLLLWNERVRNTSDSNPMPRWEPEKEWAEPLIKSLE